jgi:hypothetical protein
MGMVSAVVNASGDVVQHSEGKTQGHVTEGTK